MNSEYGWCILPLRALLIFVFHDTSNDDSFHQLRFRQDYRLERKLLAELDVDPSSHQEELSGLFATNDPTVGRHDISRVVVLHNDKIETFGNPEQSISNPDDFFDNDSFWSGSITWY